MNKTYRVAVVLQTFGENVRAIVRGIGSYAERAPNWTLYASPLGSNQETILRQAVLADGLITRLYTPEQAEIVRESGVPCVAVPYAGPLPIVCVDTNPEKIAGLAYDHLIAQGFRQFAFFGPPAKGFSVNRAACFQRLAEANGQVCHSFFAGQTEPEKFGWHANDEAIVSWLRALPKPIGILAANDVMGQQLLLNAAAAGVRVPDDAAVVGVDNDEMINRLTSPPLSSIDAAGERIGFEAAAILHRMMKGEHIENRRVIIDPARLIVRQSSDVLAVSHSNVADAVRFIRQNISRNIGVKDVMRNIPVARRTLERAFKRLLGQSIHEEITQSRVRRAKQLLIETDMTIPEITEACGYTSRTHLSGVFVKHTGHSPAAYRREFRKPR